MPELNNRANKLIRSNGWTILEFNEKMLWLGKEGTGDEITFYKNLTNIKASLSPNEFEMVKYLIYFLK